MKILSKKYLYLVCLIATNNLLGMYRDPIGFERIEQAQESERQEESRKPYRQGQESPEEVIETENPE